MSSPPLSQLEPSIQHSIPTHDNDERNAKVSLAHYFSTLFVVFIGLLLISTMILFIWSNTSDGAWVSLQVTPIINKNEDMSNDAWFPMIFSFISLNSNLKQNGVQMNSSATLSQWMSDNTNYQRLNALSATDDLNIYMFQSRLSALDIPNISDLHLNLNMFHFSLVSSVSDFWQSGAYSLAILIATFSGVWPYVKLILLLFCWLVPMRQTRREGIIIFLDQMGKFSFIDLFVSLYMIVSFYVSIKEELKSFGVALKVVVEPDIGLNTFVIGTAISMLFSHFFLYLDATYAKPVPHTKRVKAEKEDLENLIKPMHDDMNDDKTCTHYQPLCVRLVPQSMAHVLLRSCMVLLIVCTMYGCVYTVFTAPVRYNITGLVGLFVSNPVRAYSPWQIVTEVPSHTDEHEAAPPLSFCLFLSIILFPMLLIISQFIIWCAPVSAMKHLKYLNVAMQTCMSWSALDVFAVASVAASLELSRVSQWIINQNYASVCGDDGIIPNVTRHIFGESIGCFSVEGHLVYGTWILIWVSLALWCIFIYTIRQLHHLNINNKRKNDLNMLNKSIFFFNH